MMAYLEGSEDLKWLLGVIASYRNEGEGDLRGAAHVLASLHGYGDAQRYEDISRWFDSVLGVAH